MPLEVSPGREATCRAVFGTWGSFPDDARASHCPFVLIHSQGGVRRGVRASGSYQEGTGKSGCFAMWKHPRGHVWNVVVSPTTSRGAPFPPPSSRGGILSLRARERTPGVPVVSQEEALSTGKARGTPGSCHHSHSPPNAQSITGKPVSQHCLEFQAKDDSQHGGM